MNRGEFVSLIGGNGVGKSTFLQLLVGILKPIKGKVKYKKGLNLAYVHQNPMIHFSKDNVREEFLESILESNLFNKNNIDFNRDDYERLLKLNNEEFVCSELLNRLEFGNAKYKFKELIDFFDIGDLIDKHPYDCSGGEQQKIVIVKAILQNADVLILDEPTKGLDPISSKTLAKILNSLRDNGLTILMTSHDLDFVANNCRRCLMLFDKDIQIDDDPKVIFADEPTGNLDSATGERIEKLLFGLNEKKGITLIIVTHDQDLADKCQRQIHIADGQIFKESYREDFDGDGDNDGMRDNNNIHHIDIEEE